MARGEWRVIASRALSVPPRSRDGAAHVPVRACSSPLSPTASDVLIEGISLEESPRRAGWARLTARVSYEGEHRDAGAASEELWFEVPPDHASVLVARGDPFVAALAPLAALRHESLRVHAPIDALLRDSVQEVTRVWQSWYPELSAVTIEGESLTSGRELPGATASFFSGGVDSFFTALRHAAGDGTPATETIADLVLVHGFDIPIDNDSAFAHVEQSLARAAASLGKRLLVVATNLRKTRFDHTDWSRLSHGAALAAVAHAVGGAYDTVLIGSSAGYRDLRSWGSHPLTDPMFTSSRTRVLHDGPAFMRVEKTQYVARSSVAMAHLRVCWQSDDGRNCGACNNCFRTMLALDAVGALDGCATFDRRMLDLRQAGRIFCRHDYDVRQFGYVLELARANGRTDIADAVQRSLTGSRSMHRKVRLVQRLARLPGWRVRARAWERRLLEGWL